MNISLSLQGPPLTLNDHNVTTTNDRTDATETSEPTTPPKTSNTINLTNMLQTFREGRDLLSIAAENRDLNQKQRKLLTELIIRYFMETKLRMNVELARELSKSIVQVFPNEIQVSTT